MNINLSEVDDTVTFKQISELFDKTWSVGYISADQLLQCAYKPLKGKAHPFGVEYVNDIHFTNLNNAIILMKAGHTWDYSLYEEAMEIMQKSGLDRWYPIYTNYKEAAIQAGLGIRAKNSMIYSLKLGFDCHIFALGFRTKIIDYPDRPVSHKIWRHCRDCSDCIKACPAGAIHYSPDNPWLDASACENSIFYGSEGSDVPSVIEYWHKNVHPEIPNHIIDQVDNFLESPKFLPKGIRWDNKGYISNGLVVKKYGKAVLIPHCRECTSQPRCSKWDGQYPYHLED